MATTVALHSSDSKPWAWPLGGALLVIALGSLGGFLFSGGDQSWYRNLRAPVGNPPSWLFAPVWTFLYLAMGISLGILIRERNKHPLAKRALIPFIIQLMLNLAWTPVFFGAHQMGLALAIIVALWILILVTIILTKPVSRLAAWLLVSYLGWVTYATYLNASFLILNR